MTKENIVINTDGRFIYTVRNPDNMIYGWTFKADSVNQVWEWLFVNRPYWKQFQVIKFWESNPVRTAMIRTYSDATKEFQELGYDVVNLRPPQFIRWEDMTVEDKVESLKEQLLKKGVLCRDTDLIKEVTK